MARDAHPQSGSPTRDAGWSAEKGKFYKYREMAGAGKPAVDSVDSETTFLPYFLIERLNLPTSMMPFSFLLERGVAVWPRKQSMTTTPIGADQKYSSNCNRCEARRPRDGERVLRWPTMMLTMWMNSSWRPQLDTSPFHVTPSNPSLFRLVSSVICPLRMSLP